MGEPRVASRVQKGDSPLLGIAILNYNNATDTIQCISSLLASGAQNHALIAIVDNCSTDNSGQVLSEWLGTNVEQLWESEASGRCDALAPPLARVFYLRNDKNLGYGPGNNVALSALSKFNCQWYWILNNDASISPDNFARLIGHLRQHDPGPYIAGMRIHIPNTDPSEDILGGGRLQRSLGRTKPFRARDHRPVVPASLTYVSGASMLISHELLCRCGLLVESHFLFWEEQDYATRARRVGGQLECFADVTVLHNQGRASGARPGSTSPRAAFFSTRAAILYSRRHNRPYTTAIVALSRLAYAVVELAAGRLRNAVAIARAVSHGLTTQPLTGDSVSLRC